MTITINQGGVLIDGIEYRRVDAPVPAIPPKPTLDDVKAWARVHRKWVTWSMMGECFVSTKKPTIGLGTWVYAEGSEAYLIAKFRNLNPGVPWNQSLIAPDGRMLSVDGPKPKRSKRTEWRVGDSVDLIDGTRGTIEAGPVNGMYTVRVWEGCQGYYRISVSERWFKPGFPRNARRPKPKAPKLKRGMLCAMWDEEDVNGFPAYRAYFGKREGCFSSCSRWFRNGATNESWHYCVPYRPEFEGATIGEIKAILAKEATK